MRDPNRIDWLMERLRMLWHDHPDLRLVQLFEYVKSLNQGPVDGFYVEDNEWETLLRLELGGEGRKE